MVQRSWPIIFQLGTPKYTRSVKMIAPQRVLCRGKNLKQWQMFFLPNHLNRYGVGKKRLTHKRGLSRPWSKLLSSTNPKGQLRSSRTAQLAPCCTVTCQDFQLPDAGISRPTMVAITIHSRSTRFMFFLRGVQSMRLSVKQAAKRDTRFRCIRVMPLTAYATDALSRAAMAFSHRRVVWICQ
jgi:hypothetical protein